MKIFERSYYLKDTEQEKFNELITSILNQIEAFRGISYLESENQFIENIKKLLGPGKDATNIKDLIDKIKDNALKRDNFNTFLGILQKVLAIPLTNSGDKIWAKIQRYVDSLVSLNEDEDVQDQQAESHTVEELEAIVAARDREIRKVFCYFPLIFTVLICLISILKNATLCLKKSMNSRERKET